VGERWQLEGSAAEIYGEHLVPAIFGPWSPVVVEAAGLILGERVLDVACGTGVVARAAGIVVGPTGAVTGVDLNPGMVAVARAAGSLPGSCTVQYQEADVADLPFGDGSNTASPPPKPPSSTPTPGWRTGSGAVRRVEVPA
jgi:SAM-dependent methyltransferase